MWTLIGVAIAIVFTLSACSGVLKGIKWISNINTGFLLALLVMVFLAGPTSTSSHIYSIRFMTA